MLYTIHYSFLIGKVGLRFLCLKNSMLSLLYHPGWTWIHNLSYTSSCLAHYVSPNEMVMFLLRQIYRNFWHFIDAFWAEMGNTGYEIYDCVLFRKIILYSREGTKCIPFIIIVVIIYQQTYVYISHELMTQGNSTFMIFLIRGGKNCFPSTIIALKH